jgi:hypothetical protein
MRLNNGSGNGRIVFQTVSTERARIDSSGRLLVGTSSSRYGALQIEGITDEGSNIYLTRNTNNNEQPVFSFNKTRGTSTGSFTAVTNNDVLGTIRFNGANGSTLNVAAEITTAVDGTVSGGGVGDMPGRLVFSTTADGASSPTERMRITNGGGVLIGGTTRRNNVRFVVDADGTNGGATFYQPSTSSYTSIFFQNPNGDVGSIVTNGSATAYNTSSDYRLKEDWQPMTGAVDRLQQLNPVNFAWKIDGSRVDGFIAHEAQAVVPECVTGEKDEVDADGNPKYQGIDQSKLVPLLTAALQEAIAKIEALEVKVAALEAS